MKTAQDHGKIITFFKPKEPIYKRFLILGVKKLKKTLKKLLPRLGVMLIMASLSDDNERKQIGGVPEWPKGSDCKSAGSAFDGSNPSPSTILSYVFQTAHYLTL